MPVVGKARTGQDIIHGLATVNSGKAQSSYDPGAPLTERTADVASLAEFTNLDGRYKRHGGTGGSGAWEH